MTIDDFIYVNEYAYLNSIAFDTKEEAIHAELIEALEEIYQLTYDYSIRDIVIKNLEENEMTEKGIREVGQ